MYSLGARRSPSTAIGGVIADGGQSGGSGGGLDKVGTGTLTLNGANTYTGATTVSAGTLVVGDDTHPDASLASAVTVADGATFGGIGTVSGLTIGGMLAPGNSIGTLTVNDGLTLDADSTYQVEIASDGSSDSIHVGGFAALGGAKLAVDALDPRVSYQNGQTYRIVDAADGVDGKFDPTLAIDSAFLDTTVDYTKNAADLVLAVKGDETPGDGDTGNPGDGGGDTGNPGTPTVFP